MFNFLVLILTSAFAKDFVVFVDPGHGGKDRGACMKRTEESDIVLKVGIKLEKLINQTPGMRSILSRRTDTFVPLAVRAAQARHQHVSVAISLHVNSSPQKKAHGAEFYFQNQLPPDEESMFLAASENQSDEPEMKLDETLSALSTPYSKNRETKLILDDLLRNDRVRRSSKLTTFLLDAWQGPKKVKAQSVKQAPFHMISFVDMPSTLVEMGFITNTDDADMLQKESTQNAMAQGIYHGLVNFKDFIDNTPHAF